MEPAPEGDDLAESAGEFVVIEQNADIRVELRVHSSCGESTNEAVFACSHVEVLDDEGDVLSLRDSAGGEVAEFAYGDNAP